MLIRTQYPGRRRHPGCAHHRQLRWRASRASGDARAPHRGGARLGRAVVRDDIRAASARVFRAGPGADAAHLAARKARTAGAMPASSACRSAASISISRKTTPEDFIARILQRGLAARWILVGDDFRFGARRAGDFVMLKQAEQRMRFRSAGDGQRDGGRRARFEHRGARGARRGRHDARAAPAGPSLQHQRPRGERRPPRSQAGVSDRQRADEAQPPAAVGHLRGRGAWGRGARRCRASPASACVRRSRAMRVPVSKCICSISNARFTARICKVDFLHKFRDEEKYADVETLKRADRGRRRRTRATIFSSEGAQRASVNVTAMTRARLLNHG